ncbi:BnaA08g29020D [Brassica napus]|uniref:BnaA08g29020D protein n=1 Tax=Brassica napus TaxID=3708 RepID=A0A078FTJ0_BRANA|nr:BnaA08g29020D [Brassica napus]
MNQGQEYPNWLELPPELTSSILNRLGVMEILESAQKVCRSWRRICKEPLTWSKIDMRNVGHMGGSSHELEKICRHAVERSQGGLVEIEIWHFATHDLLNYIADSSSKLRSLKLAMCYLIENEGLIEVIAKLPLLEVLEVSYCSLSGEPLEPIVPSSCPNQMTLGNNCDDVALAIAESMPGLTRLQLFGNRLTNFGLNAILDRCPNLEYLDLRQCINVDIVGDMERRCYERIKVLRRPNDPVDDYPYGVSDVDEMSEEYYGNYSAASDYSDTGEDLVSRCFG